MSARAQRMASLLSDCFTAVEQAEQKSGHSLDGAERQDLVATLYINEYKVQELDRRWPARAMPKIKAHIIPVDAQGDPIDIGPNEPNTQAASDYVAQQKIHKLQRGATVPTNLESQDRPHAGSGDTGDDPLNTSRGLDTPPSNLQSISPSGRKGGGGAERPSAHEQGGQAADSDLSQKLSDTLTLLKSCPWKNSRERDRLFAEVRERLGETIYLEQLDKQGVPSPALIHPKEQQAAFYRSLLFLANRIPRPQDDPPGRAA